EEREAIREAEVGAAVVAEEALPADDELGRCHRAVLAAAADGPHLRIGECRTVELDGSLELVIEHQERRHFGHWNPAYLRPAPVVRRPSHGASYAHPYIYTLVHITSRSGAGRPISRPSTAVGLSATPGQVFEGEESGSNFGLGLAVG